MSMMLSNLAPIPELYVSYDSAQKMKHEAAALLSWDLTNPPLFLTITLPPSKYEHR